jgi:predicted RNase H-like HicB family nuclease
VSATPLQPGSQASFNLRGYAVIVRVDSDTVHHVTCPDLPQLSVSDGSLSSALSRAEVAIDAILAGALAKGEEAR